MRTTRLGVGLLTALVLGVGLAATLLAAPPEQPYVPGEVIIKFKQHATQADKDAILSDLRATHVKDLKSIKSSLNRIDRISVGEAVGRYKSHPKIEYIEPNYIIRANDIPNDPQFGGLWGMLNTGQTGGTAGADISATNAWDVFTGSDQVLIGVIDTGVDYTHPDLAANIYTNPGEIPANGIDDDNNGFIDDVRGWDFYNNDNDPMDDNGHGSHCSGTIGAVGDNGIGVAGVSWNVKILPIKFLSGGGSGSTAGAIASVEYATQMGVHLTSNSWGGGGFSQALYDAINAANTAGQLFVAAAGNSGANTDNSSHYPSSYDLPNIISVAATDHNDQLASFSNYGVVTVDLAAPGVDILSTFPGNDYGTISGTSMATPHVSGALGLVFGRFPAIGHLDAKSLLLNFADPLPNLSGVVATGARLNAFFPIADPDSIPPQQITDLVVVATGSNWMDVQWSASGDDGLTGTASRYIMKVSTSPIDDLNFDLATTVANPPDPGSVGTPESMRVAGLDFDTTYYVAVKAADEFGNASPASNSPSGTTLGVPDIASAPLSFTENLLTGATSTQLLTLSNEGFGTLDYEIPLPQLLTNPTVAAEYVNYGKDGVDPRPGILGNGGPDGFGYRWNDSDEPTGPAFAWTDISGTGTHIISSGDDENVGPFPLGFTFEFYGVEYNQIRVCSNGWLSFTSNSTAYSNQPLPNAGAPSNLIAPFWDDLLGAGGNVYYQADATSMTVQWDNVPHYGSGGPYTFQAILHSDGSIEFQYLSIGSPDNSCTIGIQNGGGTDGLQVVYNANYVHDNLKVRIAAVPQWVSVTPNAGTIYAPNSAPFDVNFDASGLLGGVYEANIQVLSNDPDESPYLIPVQMTVIGAPDIDLAPLAIDFGQVFIGATPSEILRVQNPGTDVLTVSSITVDDAVYSLSPTSFTVPARGHQDVEIIFAPLSTSSHPATVTVNSDDPDQPVATMSLNGQGVVPPDFSVSPPALASNLFTGETEQQMLTLSNGGGAELVWSIGVELLANSALYTLNPPVQPTGADPDGGVIAENFRTDPIEAELADLTGVEIMWDRSHGQTSTTSWTTIIADLESRGATVTTNSDPITAGLLAGYDIVWSVDTNTSWTASELAALGAWMGSGGGLLLEGDNSSSVTIYNEILTSLGAGIDYSTTSGASGTTSNIYSHPTTENVTGVYYTANVASIPTIVAPAVPVVDDTDGVGAAAASQVGAGRIFAMSDEVLQNSRMGTADNQLFGNQIIDWLAGDNFLTVDLTDGTVPPGGSTDVGVLFDATGLFGGLYQANINIATNDPLAPLVVVPAALSVTGAPDLTLDPTSIDFGIGYVGYPDLRGFQILNSGTDVLVITNITSDNPAFDVFLGGGSFPINLAPQSTTALQARFTAAAPGPYAGTLTIHSNDPDTPTTALAVSGQGLLPPSASVNPTSLHADLLTGEAEVQQVVLSNSGDSDLEWSSQLQFQTTSLVTLATPEAPNGADADGGVVEDPGRLVPIEAELADLTGIDILWDRSHGQTSTTSWTTILSDFEARGATVTMSTDPITPALLMNYDVLWSVDTNTSWDLAELDALTTWVNSGGALLLEGDNTSSVNIFNELLTALGVGIEFSDVNGASGTTSNIYPHVTTDGVSGVYFTANVASIPTVVAPAFPLVDDTAGVGAAAGARVGAGRVFATSDEIFQNSRMSQADNQLFGNQVMDWLSTAAFLSIDPVAGVVPPGGSVPIDVIFDAGSLYGGSYAANVQILSNDPGNGSILVAATLNVTGVARIALDPESLDFGGVFLGNPADLVLKVTNVGTDVLNVSSIAAGLPDYSMVPSNFALNPLETQDVVVTFDPQIGDRSSTLTVMSNDPDSPHVVPLLGNGLVPPIASVDPTAVHADLLTGETETQQVVLSNTGGSDLEWSTQLEFLAPTQLTTLGTPEAVVGPDEDGGTVPAGRTTPIQAELADLTGVEIMWDRSHGQTSTTSWTTIIGDFESRGATVTINNDTITPALLAGFDVLWSVDTNVSWDAAELAALVDWINAGGSLMLEGDNSSSVTIYNELSTALGAGFEFSTTSGASGTTNNIYPHPTTENVTGVYFTANVASIPTIAAPAVPLVDDTGGVGAAAAAIIGSGRVFATSDEIFQNSRMSQADNQLFGNQVMDWLTVPAYLSVSPTDGIVPPGGSVAIDVIFDATGMFGGDYAATLGILSNDPLNSPLNVAATLHVTGVPRLALSETELLFGEVYVGYPETMNLTVSNEGTDVLSVMTDFGGATDFSVDLPMFDIAPFQSQELVVSFDPAAGGMSSATMRFDSNDPDSPHAIPVTGVGVVPPVISASPDPVIGAALPGGSKTKTLSVCNTGGSDLIFSVATSEQAAQVQVHTELELSKAEDVPGGAEQVDPRPGILGSGGPDNFGYTWVDSDDPGGPVYDWTDISGVGAPLGFPSYSDDKNVGPIPIGFDFSFYGNSFSELYACSNGWLSFTNSTRTTYSNQPLPNSGSSVPENLLAPWWDDMVYDESDGNSAYYYNDGTRLIIQYDIRRIAAFTPPFYKFQVILYPNGTIVYQYHTLGSNVSSATIGIQNDAKDDGLTVVHNDGSYIHEEMAIQFSASPGWLSIAPESGVVPAGECVELDVTMDAAGLEDGDHFGTIALTSNDPATPQMGVEVAFHVGSIDAADVAIDPEALNLLSNGQWITAHVELPIGYDPADVVIETVRFMDVLPAEVDHWAWDDDYNGNGIPDLMFKFDRLAAEELLPEGESVPVWVTGEIRDTTYFIAEDLVRVFRPQMASPNGSDVLFPGMPFIIDWDNPNGRGVDYANLYYSADDGANWTEIATGIVGVTQMTWVVPNETTEAGRLRVAIFDHQGLMGFDSNNEPFRISSGVTSTDPSLPTVYTLSQNAPNPFNPITTIRFELPNDSMVSLRIYDIRGRLVAQPVSRWMVAGRHDVTWRGLDSRGSRVASGVYLYSIKAGHFQDTKRMILVK